MRTDAERRTGGGRPGGGTGRFQPSGGEGPTPFSESQLFKNSLLRFQRNFFLPSEKCLLRLSLVNARQRTSTVWVDAFFPVVIGFQKVRIMRNVEFLYTRIIIYSIRVFLMRVYIIFIFFS